MSVVPVFFLLPLRTLEEQQQAKPSTAVCEASGVATAPTYVDSPRKVSVYPVCVDPNELLQAFSF